MNLFNSVRTQPVSRKNYSPKTFVLQTSPDGTLVRVELDNKPIPADAKDFSIENMQKTGVTFAAPNGVFIRPTNIQVSDHVLNASDILVKLPEPVVISPVDESFPVEEPKES